VDNLLGGGLLEGAAVLIGGEPGVGKTTLLLQISENVCKGGKVIYVCAEESLAQMRAKAKKIGLRSDALYLLPSQSVEEIKECVNQTLPILLVVDSVQALQCKDVDSVPGSLAQVRECASTLLSFCKKEGISLFLVAHVTKEGIIAGPKILEHMVDVVLYFEGEWRAGCRLLRCTKNRFGPSHNIALLQMEEGKLTEVADLSSYLLRSLPREEPGSVIVPLMEGGHPLLVEIQALVSRSFTPYPRREIFGINPNRASLLIALMDKRMRTRLFEHDVFINVAGGVRVQEPAADLGIIMAIISSLKERVLPSSVLVCGEVGLCGEVRGVPNIRRRMKEAERLGFSKCILPKENVSEAKGVRLELLCIERVDEIFRVLGTIS
jgi:DNA repair protein RadA/Sms